MLKLIKVNMRLLSYVPKDIKMTFHIYVNMYILECTLIYIYCPYIIPTAQSYWFPLLCANQGSFSLGSCYENYQLLRMMKTSIFASLVNVVECLK